MIGISPSKEGHMFRKYVALLVLFLLIAVSSSAMFCNKCGSELPDDSAFCSKCGQELKASVNEKNAAELSEPDMLKRLDVLFQPVDNCLTYIQSSNYVTIIAKLPEFKIELDKNADEIKAIESKGSERVKKFSYFHKEKYVQAIMIIPAFLDSLGASFAKARLSKSLYLTAHADRMLDLLRNNESVEKVSNIDNSVKKAAEEIKVTSKHLMIDKHKIPKDDALWVKEVANGKAFIIHMGVSLTDSPITGWVPIDELKKRTSWVE